LNERHTDTIIRGGCAINEMADTVRKGGGRAMGLGIVTMILGAIALAGPRAVGVLLGIKLFFAGLMMITLGTTVRAPAKDAEA
jgi:uncharacterized membrane protein HdeD (DUF308 family)